MHALAIIFYNRCHVHCTHTYLYKDDDMNRFCVYFSIRYRNFEGLSLSLSLSFLATFIMLSMLHFSWICVYSLYIHCAISSHRYCNNRIRICSNCRLHTDSLLLGRKIRNFQSSIKFGQTFSKHFHLSKNSGYYMLWIRLCEWVRQWVSERKQYTVQQGGSDEIKASKFHDFKLDSSEFEWI